jgi:hypothetical protein
MPEGVCDTPPTVTDGVADVSVPMGCWRRVRQAMVAWAVRRYRKSVGSDLPSFTAYIYGSVRLSIGRRFSPILARQFGIRQYAGRVHAVFPGYLVIP